MVQKSRLEILTLHALPEGGRARARADKGASPHTLGTQIEIRS